MPQEYKQVEVTYKFYLPDNESDLKMAQNAYKYHSTLNEIYQRCRSVYKYDDKASEELIRFAQEIAGMACVLDD